MFCFCLIAIVNIYIYIYLYVHLSHIMKHYVNIMLRYVMSRYVNDTLTLRNVINVKVRYTLHYFTLRYVSISFLYPTDNFSALKTYQQQQPSSKLNATDIQEAVVARFATS